MEVESTVITLAVALVGVVSGAIARDRQLTRMITDGDHALHERIDVVKDNFVRRVDLENHMTRIDTSIRDLTSEQRDTNKLISEVLVNQNKRREDST